MKDIKKGTLQLATQKEWNEGFLGTDKKLNSGVNNISKEAEYLLYVTLPAWKKMLVRVFGQLIIWRCNNVVIVSYVWRGKYYVYNIADINQHSKPFYGPSIADLLKNNE